MVSSSKQIDKSSQFDWYHESKGLKLNFCCETYGGIMTVVFRESSANSPTVEEDEEDLNENKMITVEKKCMYSGPFTIKTSNKT